MISDYSTLPEPPSDDHKLGILFPVDSEVPQFIWVKCELRENKDNGSKWWQIANIREILDVGNANPAVQGGVESKSVMYNNVRKVSLGYTLQIFYRDYFLVDGSKLNVCVRSTTGNRDWKGPILIMRHPGTGLAPKYEDVTSSDVWNAQEFFRTPWEENPGI